MKSVSGEKARRWFDFYTVCCHFGGLPIGWMVCLWEDRRAYRKRDGENHLRSSAEIQEALDQRFAEIENLARQMSSESKVLSFQFEKEPFAGTGPYRLWDLEKSLFNYKLFNHFIVDYYIAYRNSNMIVSPRKVYTVDQYYRMHRTMTTSH